MLQSKLRNQENKFKDRKKGPQYCKLSFCSKDIPTFNELVMKNTTFKNKTIFAFMKRFHLSPR